MTELSVLSVFLTRYRSITITLLHIVLAAALASALYAFGIIRFLPAENTLMQWDVFWYDQIRQSGYAYSATSTSNAPFFPLFPYFWRLTGLGLLSISLLNLAFFLAAFSWLAHQLQLPARLQLLLLSSPLLLFMVVPYTEALFFCFATLLLLGLRRRRLLWWVLGLLGCGLTRSASTLFTPSLLFMVLLWASQPGQLRTALRWGAAGLLALLVTIGSVAIIQWKQVGEPWAFILAHKHWGHTLGWLRLPLIDPCGIDMLWLDALALWVGLAAIGVCCWLTGRWLMHARGRATLALPFVSPEIVFSLGYCVSVTLFILFSQGGGISNAGRYTFATPFFVVLLGQLARQPAWPWQRYLTIGVATLLLGQMFGLYTQQFDNFTLAQGLWYFGLLTAYLLAYLAWRHLRWQGEVTVLLYMFNMIVLLHLLEGWLQGYVVE